jgi:hypothetical protein
LTAEVKADADAHFQDQKVMILAHANSNQDVPSRIELWLVFEAAAESASTVERLLLV